MKRTEMMTRNKTRQEYQDYSTSTEATEMLKNKHLSVASIKEFGFCYIPSHAKAKTELLWERLALPIHNCSGEIIAYAGRKITSSKPAFEGAMSKKYLSAELAQAKVEKWEKSKWINEPYEKAKNLFNLHRAYKSIITKNHVYMVEGYFDVIAFYNKGIENVVATCGTNISTYQAYLIKALCDNCFIMFDGDDAGNLASNEGANTLRDLGINTTQIFLPDDTDPDEYIIKKNAVKFENAMREFLGVQSGQIFLK